MKHLLLQTSFIFLLPVGIQAQWAKNIEVEASCQQYSTAMGKGKGYLFRINLQNMAGKLVDYKVQKFIVCKTVLPFKQMGKGNKMMIESNYSRSEETPSLNKDGTIGKSKQKIDSLLDSGCLSPAYLLIKYRGKKGKIFIHSFKTLHDF